MLQPETVQSGQDERAGFLSLFRGSMLGIRNPGAHELFKPADAQRPLSTWPSPACCTEGSIRQESRSGSTKMRLTELFHWHP
jgi:hypothetical protein